MNNRYDHLGKFSVLPVAEIWGKDFTPALEATPAIGEFLRAAMEKWVKKIREINPDFAAGLELPIKFDPNVNPLKLHFYANGYGPRFDDDEMVGPEQNSYWRSSRNRFLFSSLWIDLCKAWMPDGNWLRLDTESHSILMEMNSRAIFDPSFYASRNAEYILDMSIIAEPVKTADYQQTSNVVAWLKYHLKWHFRYNLPEVFEEALRHDLPEYLQIMQTFANVEMPSLKATPLSEAQLANMNSVLAPVNARMI